MISNFQKDQSKKQSRKSKRQETLISKGVRVVGIIEFEGSLNIYGTVDGDIVSSGDGGYVYLGSDARVNGKVSAARMDIHGHVEGDIFCSNRLMFGSDSSCNGDVHYNDLQIEAGAKVSGRMVRADNPAAAIPKVNENEPSEPTEPSESTDADL